MLSLAYKAWIGEALLLPCSIENRQRNGVSGANHPFEYLPIHRSLLSRPGREASQIVDPSFDGCTRIPIDPKTVSGDMVFEPACNVCFPF